MSTNQVLYNYQKKEQIKKVKRWLQEGKTKDEIFRLVDKRYLTEDEINNELELAKEYMKDNDNESSDEISEDELIIDNVEEIENKNTNKVIMIADSSLEDYHNQPFKLYDDDKKKEMIESIKINGIMQPLIVRPIGSKKYQILAGHNRRICGREVGLKEFPCIVKEGLSDDDAIIYLVDTNLCTRDKISTMERARAYKIKYDIYKKKNIKTSVTDEIKKDNPSIRNSFVKVEKASNGTIQRYLRLTYLIPQLQTIVEKQKININVAEKLSFLPKQEQRIISDLLDIDKIKLSESLAKKIRIASENKRKNSQYECLSKQEILDLIKMKKENDNESVTIIFTKEEVNKYFKKYGNKEQIKKCILKWATEQL